MIAELNGKISSTGTNLSNRLEDNLTGNFFGTIRYLEYKSLLLNINLSHGNKKQFDNIINSLHVNYFDARMVFWPYDEEGEIDLIIDLNHIGTGIEVKYLSGLSSDDDVENNTDNFEKISDNQLSREARIVSRIFIVGDNI